MKLLTALLFAATLIFGQATVFNERVDGITHSAARLIADTSAAHNAVRAEYAQAPTACDGGGNAPQGSGAAVYFKYAEVINISGLAPSTLYNGCLEVSTDGGSTWSAPVNVSFTTLPAPAVDPAPPIAPTTFSTVPQDPTNTTVLTVASDCSDLQSKIGSSSSVLVTNGTTIQIPPNTQCTGQYIFPTPSDMKSFTMDAAGTVAQPSHGFSNGQAIRLGTTGALPGADVWPWGLNYNKTGGFQPGTVYYVVNATSNTFQLSTSPGGAVQLPGYVLYNSTSSGVSVTPDVGYRSGVTITAGNPLRLTASGPVYYPLQSCPAYVNEVCNFQISLTVGGAPVTPANGSGIILTPGSGTQYLIPWPPVSPNRIVIRSSATDAQLSLPGVQISPSAQPYMATFTRPGTGFYGNDYSFAFGILAHNITLGPGLEFVPKDTATAEVKLNNDPKPFNGWLYTNQDTGNVILDRVYMHGLGAPNRIYQAVPTFDGANIGIVASYLSKLDFPHTWFSGFSASVVSPTQVVLTAGNAHLANGLVPATTSVTTINLTGLSAGAGVVYVDLAGVLQVQLPTGASATVVTAGMTASVSTSASPSFPVNSIGQSLVEKIATLTLSSTGFTSASAADGFSSVFDTEGCQCIIAGNGPGPTMLTDNWISATGIPLHYDDSGGYYLHRSDSSILRNTFDTPAYALQGGPSSDGFLDGHRQSLEDKGMERQQIVGNTFQGNFDQDTNAGVVIALTPRGGGVLRDIDIRSNVFKYGQNGINLGGAIDSSGASTPSQRLRFANNLFINNGWNHFTPATLSYAPGYQFFGGYSLEDMTIDHNTVYDPRGPFIEFLHQESSPIHGMVLTNNFMWPDARMAFQTENVTGCAGAGAGLPTLKCLFTTGINNPSLVSGGNVAVPTYTNMSNVFAPTGAQDPGQVCTVFGGVFANGVCTGGFWLGVRSESTVPLRIAAVGWDTDYSLLATSPYKNAGTDGTDVGVNMPALLLAQGSTQPAPAPAPAPTPTTTTTGATGPAGPAGPQGPAGPMGPQGPPGTPPLVNPFTKHIAPGDSCFSAGSQMWASPILEWSTSTFTCTLLNVPAGDYQFTFGLQEPNQTKALQRIFTISVNGNSTLPIDLYSMAKQNLTKIVQRLYLPTTGTVTLTFAASVRNAVVSTIDVLQLN